MFLHLGLDVCTQFQPLVPCYMTMFYDFIVGCYLACTCFDFIFMLHHLLFERKVITFHASIFVSSLLKGYFLMQIRYFYLPIKKLE
jgi:hypothetical protein